MDFYKKYCILSEASFKYTRKYEFRQYLRIFSKKLLMCHNTVSSEVQSLLQQE
jgi:hypothetical protein